MGQQCRLRLAVVATCIYPCGSLGASQIQVMATRDNSSYSTTTANNIMREPALINLRLLSYCQSYQMYNQKLIQTLEEPTE